MAHSMFSQADQVIFQDILGGRKVILNAPKKLNALGYEMILQMFENLQTYEMDPTVKIVVLKAYGKVFSVGGDLVAAWKIIPLAHWSVVATYYRKVFTLDYLLATYKKPMVAIIDGAVMGGGVGISIHSTFRIVTENTIFAMPEASIGLFPDVGASYFLSRLPGFFGEYMGLTGTRLDAAEMLAVKLGTHFVPSQKLQSLEKALEKLVASSNATCLATMSIVINKFAQEVKVKPTSPISRLELINKCFSGDSCEEILFSLERLPMEVKEKWIHNAITSMKSASPIGLKIFLRTIREGRSKNIKQCLETEYIAISHFLRGTVSNDFYEFTWN
ncbi:3-hydroxyisobutyryl-CoA hydrolase 1 [Lactuca sativa]|uniref:3-hydroxyisobutyryl-CoA hydrolase 1 n=1 Tax=Lactuca sativa TaxID=4236 RepID=UPI0022B02D90|nr:3-hydroxyisobutyryl-CoA hydrolase 1 [Lactuca sativa]